MDKQSSNIAILIMAAGSSSRMGSPKQLLPWGTSTLLEHSIATAQKSKAAKVIVVLGANAVLVQDQLDLCNVDVTINSDWKRGLGKSIAHGVRYLKDSHTKIDGALVVLSDQPQVDHQYLNKLIDIFKVGRRQIVGTSYYEKIGVPVLFDSCYFEQLSKLDNDQGAKTVIDEHEVHLTTCSPTSILIDIDTLETYEKLHSSTFSN